jgi:hypothetical protein
LQGSFGQIAKIDGQILSQHFPRDAEQTGIARGEQMQTSKYLNRKAASTYLLSTWGLRRSGNYLAKLAVVGGGPPFRKAGRDPLYTVEDLDGWASSLIGPRVRSTSELPQNVA